MKANGKEAFKETSSKRDPPKETEGEKSRTVTEI